MPNPYGNAESLERARRSRWAGKTAEQRQFASEYANAVRSAKIRGDGLERCIVVQSMIAYHMRKAFEEGDTALFFQTSMHLLAWEKQRMVREKMEPQSVQYQPTPEEPTETVLSGVDQEELERLATSVPAYRGAGSDTGKNPLTRRPFRQRTPGLVTGIAEQDQKAAARRKEEAQIAANARPLHEEEK